MNESAIKALTKAVAKADRDNFDIGTVIRWMVNLPMTERVEFSDEPVPLTKDYTYAAIKTEVGWYTTGRTRAGDRVLSYENLVKALTGRRVVTGSIEVATDWTPIG